MTATDTEAVPELPAQRLLIDVPPHYDLVRLVGSAAVPVLAPLVFAPDQAALQAVVYPPHSQPAEVLIHQIEPSIPLLVYGIPEGTAAEPMMTQLRTMLSLDEDLETFYALCDLDKGLRWVREKDAGRRLRSPTVFEELVKCLIRSRLPPGRAHLLVSALCSKLGARTNLRRAAFPTAEAMASVKPRFYERELQAGVLSGPLLALAECCAGGPLYPESLRRPPRPYSELISDEESFEEVVGEELEWQFRLERLCSRLPGFGPKARDLLMPLLGCYDQLALDMTTVRAWQKRFRTLRGNDAEAALKNAQGQNKDGSTRVRRAIARRVARFSLYGGLAERLLLHGDGVW